LDKLNILLKVSGFFLIGLVTDCSSLVVGGHDLLFDAVSGMHVAFSEH